jgi:hypothetical protein
VGKKKLVQIVPIVVLVAWGVWRQWGVGGGLKGFLNGWFWVNQVLLVAGWVGGWLLANVEEMPMVRTKLKEYLTEGKPAVKNMLTVAVLLVLGVWVVTSSASLLGCGLVMGMEAALFWYYLQSGQEKWYWVFARKFSVAEQKMIMLVWLVVLVAQMGLFLRR